ncbi:hypothetical protein [Corallococcus sp. EGB]|uniref:hypothetical protein n=1 Tax=Corallococcus sp. EGB TaxID=1521117 RepID=UPI001CBC5AB7|nr:hypothetical protein [Corallococcus sp. EGB]
MTAEEMTRIIDTLYAHRAPALPAHALAEIFNRMLWCLDDEGAALLQVGEDWLSSDDRGRVAIALAMDETFPFNDSKKMDEVLSWISSKWPDLSARCQRIREMRAASESGDS